MNSSRFHFFSEDRSHQLIINFSDIRDNTYLIILEIETPEIKGIFRKPNIFQETLQTFYKQLIELEKTRRGEAILKATDPKELVLKIKNLDENGHLKLNVQIQSYDYSMGTPATWNKLEWTFEIDPYSVQKLIQNFDFQ